MKMKWRRKGGKEQDSVSRIGSEDGKTHNSKKWRGDSRSVSNKKLKLSDQKGNSRKPKWALSRPPPVQTHYSDDGDFTPRISMQCTMKELQEEAMARGIERKFLPNNKADISAAIQNLKGLWESSVVSKGVLVHVLACWWPMNETLPGWKNDGCLD